MAIDWKKWWSKMGVKTLGNHGEHLIEQEPYMVTVSASRTQGDAALFDSEHRHQGFIQLRVSTAHRDRGLGRDWIHSGKELIEVAMSEAQWAAMISSLNFGSGVPATLQHLLCERVKQPKKSDDRTNVFHSEFMLRIEAALEKIDAMSQGRLTKAQKNELAMIRQEIESNAPFMARQFEEHMENRVEKSKSDIEAHMNNAVQRVGLAALSGSDRLTKLLESDID